MLLENKVIYRYYRNIPKGWREYVKSESKEPYNYRNRKRKKKEYKTWDKTMIKAPHLYKRQGGFNEPVLFGVPPAPRGGMTECCLEMLDSDTNASIIFVGRVKCSNKDSFSYKIGRELAYEAAKLEYEKWQK